MGIGKDEEWNSLLIICDIFYCGAFGMQSFPSDKGTMSLTDCLDYNEEKYQIILNFI